MDQLPNKIQIPVKTKISAWLLFFLAVWCTFLLIVLLPLTVLSVYRNILAGNLSGVGLMIITIIQSGLTALLYWAIPFFLLKPNGRAWKIGVIFLAIMLCYNFAILSGNENHQGSVGPMIYEAIVLILLFSDRKNYFAAVEKARNKTNG